MYHSCLPISVADSLTAPLVVVIPVYNEAATLPTLTSEWLETFSRLGVSAQLLLLNDGSRDNSREVLRELEQAHPDHLVVVDKPNQGHGRTCRFGYDACAAAPAVEWVLQIDSDGQCDPGYFEEFWKAREGAEAVFGRRYSRDDGQARVMTSRLCQGLSSLVTGVRLIDPNVPYRLIQQQVLAAALEDIPPSFDIHNVALTWVLTRRGVTMIRIPIHFRDRQGGSNSINLVAVARMGLGLLAGLIGLRRQQTG